MRIIITEDQKNTIMNSNNWEEVSGKLIKTFYFRMTQRGGFAGDKENRNTSKVIPIEKWIQRI